MSLRKHRQFDRSEKTAGARPSVQSPSIVVAKPSARHKVLLAASAVLLAAWLAFLVMLAVLSNSKVKTVRPPADSAVLDR